MNTLLERLHHYRQCPPSKTLASNPPPAPTPTSPPPDDATLVKLTGRRFDLGQMVMTPGIKELVTSGEFNPGYVLRRHASGDWGDLEDADKRRNDTALRDGSRIFSSYDLPCGKVWCITEGTDEAGKRSNTTLMLPEEY